MLGGYLVVIQCIVNGLLAWCMYHTYTARYSHHVAENRNQQLRHTCEEESDVYFKLRTELSNEHVHARKRVTSANVAPAVRDPWDPV